MNEASITKILKKIDNEPREYSLGFKRLTVLPNRVRKNFGIACVLRGDKLNEVHKNQVSFLESLTDQEYINWLKTM